MRKQDGIRQRETILRASCAWYMCWQGNIFIISHWKKEAVQRICVWENWDVNWKRKQSIRTMYEEHLQLRFIRSRVTLESIGSALKIMRFFIDIDHVVSRQILFKTFMKQDLWVIRTITFLDVQGVFFLGVGHYNAYRDQFQEWITNLKQGVPKNKNRTMYLYMYTPIIRCCFLFHLVKCIRVFHHCVAFFFFFLHIARLFNRISLCMNKI